MEKETSINKDMNKFKAGDLVELKSGGPTMVVDNLEIMKPLIKCAWFNDDDIVQYEGFAEHVLEKVETFSEPIDEEEDYCATAHCCSKGMPKPEHGKYYWTKWFKGDSWKPAFCVKNLRDHDFYYPSGDHISVDDVHDWRFEPIEEPPKD